MLKSDKCSPESLTPLEYLNAPRKALAVDVITDVQKKRNLHKNQQVRRKCPRLWAKLLFCSWEGVEVDDPSSCANLVASCVSLRSSARAITLARSYSTYPQLASYCV